MKKITSALLAAMLVATLGCGVFAADESSEASSEAASEASSEASSEAASEASSEAASETETVAVSTTEAAAEATSEAAPAVTAPAPAPVAPAAPAEPAAPAFERDPDKALLLFDVEGTVYYSQIEYGNQIRLYPEVPKYITDENGNKLVFNVWMDEDGVPFYPGKKVEEDVELYAHYAFASFTPDYLFLATNKLNQQFAPKGPFTTILANLPAGETRDPADLTYKTGNYDLLKVVKQADGSARAYGSKVGTTYVAVKDSITDTIAYVHAVTYDPALQKNNKAPVLTIEAPEWSDTATTWSWHADPSIPKMVK